MATFSLAEKLYANKSYEDLLVQQALPESAVDRFFSLEPTCQKQSVQVFSSDYEIHLALFSSHYLLF